MRCLITGGSSGIGLEMAKYLSSLGHEVVLVSKDENKLLKVSESIKRSRVYVGDLTYDSEVKKLCEYILSKS